jgi:hypothetical protein
MLIRVDAQPCGTLARSTIDARRTTRGGGAERQERERNRNTLTIAIQPKIAASASR